MRWDLIHKINKVAQSFSNGEVNPYPKLEDEILKEMKSDEISFKEIFDIMCICALTGRKD